MRPTRHIARKPNSDLDLESENERLRKEIFTLKVFLAHLT